MGFLRDLLLGKQERVVSILPSLYADSGVKCDCPSCQPAKDESDYMKFRSFVIAGNIEEAERMLSDGYDIETRNDYDQTVLQEFFRSSKNLDSVPFLISHGAKFTTDQLSFLLGQSYWNQALVTKIFDAAIGIGWSDYDFKDDWGSESLFFRACRGCNFKMMRRLFEMGVDLEEENSFGETVRMVIKRQMREREAEEIRYNQHSGLWVEAGRARTQKFKAMEVLELINELEKGK